MRDVHLVETDGEPGDSDREPMSAAYRPDPAAVARPGIRTGGRPRQGRAHATGAASRRLRGWAAGAAGLAVVLLAGSLLERGAAAGRERELAGLPGILQLGDGAPVEVWRRDLELGTRPAGSNGRLIGVERTRDGTAALVALDSGSGQTRWRVAAATIGTPATGARCVLAARDSTQAGSAAEDARLAAADGTTPASIAGCVVTERTAARPDNATTARLVVLDAEDGDVLSTADLEPGSSLTAAGGEVLVSHVDVAGRLVVRSIDPLGGAARWTFVTPARPLPVPHDPVSRGRSTVRAVGALVLVSQGRARWALHAGVLVGTWTADGIAAVGPGLASLSADVVVEPVSIDRRTCQLEITNVRTGRSVVVPGTSAAARPDDGSLAGTLFAWSRAGHLAAHDATSGRALWTLRHSVGHGSVVIFDRRVTVLLERTLRTVDGRTGRTIWEVPAVHPAQALVFSDGHSVVIAHRAPGGGSVLTAYRLDDGRVRWQAEQPTDPNLDVVDGRLLLISADEVVALGGRET